MREKKYFYVFKAHTICPRTYISELIVSDGLVNRVSCSFGWWRREISRGDYWCGYGYGRGLWGYTSTGALCVGFGGVQYVVMNVWAKRTSCALFANNTFS